MKKSIVSFIAAVVGVLAIGFAIPACAEDMLAAQVVESFKDNYTGYSYKNITSMDKFVAALDDPYTPDMYGAVMERSRFAALQEGNRESYTDTNMCELASLSIQFERK